MVEERTLKVLLRCWIDHWPKIIWREDRELELDILGMRMSSFMEMHVNTKAWL